MMERFYCKQGASVSYPEGTIRRVELNSAACKACPRFGQECKVRYYKIRSSKKSHGDYPNPWFEDYFWAMSEEQKAYKVKNMTRGCEDYDVKEVSMEAYREALGD